MPFLGDGIFYDVWVSTATYEVCDGLQHADSDDQ